MDSPGSQLRHNGLYNIWTASANPHVSEEPLAPAWLSARLIRLVSTIMESLVDSTL